MQEREVCGSCLQAKFLGCRADLPYQFQLFVVRNSVGRARDIATGAVQSITLRLGPLIIGPLLKIRRLCFSVSLLGPTM
jgi:hypothetical protein